MASQQSPRLVAVASPGWRVAPESSPVARRRGAVASPTGDDLIAQLVATRRVTSAGAYVAQRSAASGAKSGDHGPLAIDFDVDDSHSFVAIARHPSGAITFHPPSIVSARRAETVKRDRTSARVTIRFTIHSGSAGIDTSRRRGLVTKLVRVVLMKVARAGVGSAAGNLATPLLGKLAAKWEQSAWKSKPGGLVSLTAVDGRVVAASAADAPAPGPARNLLFLHGTFSDVAGCYGPLAALDAAGSSPFDVLRGDYDGRVFGFNHFTVSESPEDNARALLAALPAGPTTFDVVTHSRGALVLRTLTERAADLGPNASRFQLGRAVLVAGPNQGTPLAAPERWMTLTSWLANLVDLFPDNPFTFGVSFLAEALGWMAKHALGALPGLASMTPDGPVITALQQPSANGARLVALASNFEPDAGIVARFGDVGVDAFFGSANDLVVPTEGGWRVDWDASNPAIGANAIGCFGPGGNIAIPASTAVNHCNFFAHPDATAFITRALRGEPLGLAPLDPLTQLPYTRTTRRAPHGGVGPGPKGVERTMRHTAASTIARVDVPGRVLDEVFQLFVVSPSLADTDDTAVIVAAFRNARVVEPFRKRGEAAGGRWREIISARHSIDRFIEGDPKFPRLPSERKLVRLGSLLFETLFPGQVRRLYDVARAELRDQRLDVSFTSMIRWVADKPWEFAYDPGRRTFLCTEEVNFIRNVFTAVPADSIPHRTGPLRILVASAQAAGSDAAAGNLSADDEIERIRDGFSALERAGVARVEVMVGVTAASLHARLERSAQEAAPFDALHFIGHGEYRAAEGMGYLLLSDGADGLQPLAATHVREIVSRRGIRLVFLNACETGRGFGRGNPDFAAGLAPYLVAGGVPAVVANQFKVLDPSAAAFAQHFYWSLGVGRSIGDSMREARVAVSYLATAERIDWAVPVLFTRNPGDRLVEPQISATGSVASP